LFLIIGQLGSGGEGEGGKGGWGRMGDGRKRDFEIFFNIISYVMLILKWVDPVCLRASLLPN